MKRHWRLGLICGILTTLFSCQAIVVGQLAAWLEPAEQEQLCDLAPLPARADHDEMRWRPLRERGPGLAQPHPVPPVPPCPLTFKTPVPSPQPPAPKAPTPCATTVTTVKVLVLAPTASPPSWS